MNDFSLKNGLLFFLISYFYYIFSIPFKATIIAAVDAEYGGIGFEFTLPWRVSSDMREFKRVTSKKRKLSNARNIMICGRVTYESLNLTTLPDRNMIVVTSNIEFDSANLQSSCKSFQYLNKQTKLYVLSTGEKLVFISDINKIQDVISCFIYDEMGIPEIFVIGGGKIYRTFISDFVKGIKVNKCLITHINPESTSIKSVFNRKYDTFFPLEKLKLNFKEFKSKVLEPGVILKTYKRKKS